MTIGHMHPARVDNLIDGGTLSTQTMIIYAKLTKYITSYSH